MKVHKHLIFCPSTHKPTHNATQSLYPCFRAHRIIMPFLYEFKSVNFTKNCRTCMIIIIWIYTYSVARFTNNYYPRAGRVNMFGSSHQWWHIMILVAFGWAHHMGVVVFTYWRTHSCTIVTQTNTDSWSLYAFLGIKV